MPPEKQYDITPDKLEHMHYDDMMSPQEIADSFGCSRSLIYHYLDEFGIEKRPKNQNLLGQRFARLTVKEFLGINEQRQAEWRCICDCGKETITTTGKLNHGLKSCGCYQIDHATTHGLSGTRQYRIWLAMKSRCDNPSSGSYEYYAARGISYCERWSNFENFWSDMQDGYSDNKTIDRIDNDGDYCPENCRWSTVKQQNQHKRNSVVLTYRGKSLNATQWGKQLGVPRDVIYHRHNAGWSDRRILETPYEPAD